MNIKDFKAGVFRRGYEYEFFLPERINRRWIVSDDSSGCTW